jgi:FixJ family two-component response regulator
MSCHVDLGKGTSGIELAPRTKASGHSVAVIFMSGSDPERTHAAAVKVGCVAYLTRPFFPSALIEAIERAACRTVQPLVGRHATYRISGGKSHVAR